MKIDFFEIVFWIAALCIVLTMVSCTVESMGNAVSAFRGAA